MRRRFDNCRQLVCKLWQSCKQHIFLSPRVGYSLVSMFINTYLYQRFTRRFTARFYTSKNTPHLPLLPYFYPLYTPPTSTTTRFLNLICFSDC